MSDRTYVELCKNSKHTVQLNMWIKTTGVSFSPSAGFCTVKGTDKDTVIIPKIETGINENSIWTTIDQTVTVSAAEYDIYWEIRRNDGGITNHCTKLLVVDTC